MLLDGVYVVKFLQNSKLKSIWNDYSSNVIMSKFRHFVAKSWKRSGLPSRFSLLRTLVCGWWWAWLVAAAASCGGGPLLGALIEVVYHKCCARNLHLVQSMQYSEDASASGSCHLFCMVLEDRLKCPILSSTVDVVARRQLLLQFIEINVPPLGETICPPLGSSYDLRLLLLSCQMELR